MLSSQLLLRRWEDLFFKKIEFIELVCLRLKHIFLTRGHRTYAETHECLNEVYFFCIHVPYFSGHRPVFFFSNARTPAYPPGSAIRRLKVEIIKHSNLKSTVFSSLSSGLFFFRPFELLFDSCRYIDITEPVSIYVSDSCPVDDFFNDIASNKMYSTVRGISLQPQSKEFFPHVHV